MAKDADAQATFAVDMEDGTSGPAESAANALANLQRSIDSDTKALASMQRAMKNLQQGSVVNVEQFRKLKEQIDAKKASVAKAQSAYLSLGGTFGKLRPKPAAQGLTEVANAAKGLGGPLASAIGQVEGLSKLFAGGALSLGIAAVAAAVVALTVATVAATAALLKYGIGVANARRAEGLRLEALTKMRNWYGVAAGKASDMQAAIDRVSGSTTLGRGQLEQYAAQLYKMHLRGDNLSQALEGAAIKASALGDEAAKGFMGWAAGAAMAGRSVKRLADDVRARYGGIVAKQMLDLDVQAAKLRENFGALFAGLKIEGLLKAVSSVTSLFSQSTKSGQALRAIVSRVFQPLISAVEYVAPLVKRFFQGMVIGALYIGIALLTVRKWFRQTFGDSQILKGIDLTSVALGAGVIAVGMLASGFGVLAYAIGLAVGPMLVIGAALFGLGKLAIKAWNVFTGIEWSALGKSIVDGIVGGLKRGAKWVIDAVKNLGDQAMSALKSKLGIASPSRAFARLGVEIPRGIETGVETGTPGARNAVANIVDAPNIPAAAVDGKGAKSPAARGATAFNVGGITINVQSSAETPTELVADIGRELEGALGKIFERLAFEMGASVPGSAT